MRGQLLFVLIVAAAMAVLTWVMGWWGVLFAAVVVGVAFRDVGGGGWRVALAGALAWAALLLVDVVAGSFAHLSQLLAGVMKLPALALVVVTLLFAAALAWSGATITSAIVTRLFPVKRA